MHLGEFKFKQKSSKDEQAVSDESVAGGKVAKLLGMFLENILYIILRTLLYL